MDGRHPAGLTRRGFVAGAALALARPDRAMAATPEPLAAIFARSGLAHLTGFALADAATGALIEAHDPDASLPPASVAKIPTALYALDALGPGFRFPTRVLAIGPLEAGVLAGDLVLDGGGDPVLDTDRLGELVAAVRTFGLTRVAGRFLVADGALPRLDEIEPGQPRHAGYNPAISGMNLNFNRVHVDWAPGGAGPRLGVSAPGERFTAPVAGIAAAVGGTGLPLHAAVAAGGEAWTLPRATLAGSGSIWLPVRHPAAYAGEVFAALAAQAGLALPPPGVIAAAPAATELAVSESPDLARMMTDMLRFSTNLTAEVAGLTASGAPPSLAASAGRMSDWLAERYGLADARFVNHSGLSERSRMSPAAMVRLLVAEAARLPALLRERTPRGADGQPALPPGARLLAKTGTLNFSTALAGYVETPGGRRLAFAIFAADPAARARLPDAAADDPPGAAAWEARARAQEAALVARWAALAA